MALVPACTLIKLRHEPTGTIGEIGFEITRYKREGYQVTVKTDKPIFSAIPLITGIGEKELVEKIIVKVREIQEEKNNK